jgi:hypothetical protein
VIDPVSRFADAAAAILGDEILVIEPDLRRLRRGLMAADAGVVFMIFTVRTIACLPAGTV